jgi:hypothetical protein
LLLDRHRCCFSWQAPASQPQMPAPRVLKTIILVVRVRRGSEVFQSKNKEEQLLNSSRVKCFFHTPPRPRLPFSLFSFNGLHKKEVQTSPHINQQSTNAITKY